MKTIVTVLGTRPQFVKAAAVSTALRSRGLREIVIDTGQHHDDKMAGVFFRELGIGEPTHRLRINGGTHGVMTGRMLEAAEPLVRAAEPSAVLVYGDTNSTLAGALAAAKLALPVVHVEAGLRSGDLTMPEEVNRVVVDRVSSLCFAPTRTAVNNLRQEGRTEDVYHVGDVMYDITLWAADKSRNQSAILDDLGLTEKSYSLATIHRAASTDDSERLASLLDYLRAYSGSPVILPLHPRTRAAIIRNGLSLDKLVVLDPVGYFDMQRLLTGACQVLTDSGGLQKEAYFHGIPCVTLRSETEWTETIDHGWNRLWTTPNYLPRSPISDYGDGTASGKIADLVASFVGE